MFASSAPNCVSFQYSVGCRRRINRYDSKTMLYAIFADRFNTLSSASRKGGNNEVLCSYDRLADKNAVCAARRAKGDSNIQAYNFRRYFSFKSRAAEAVSRHSVGPLPSKRRLPRQKRFKSRILRHSAFKVIAHNISGRISGQRAPNTGFLPTRGKGPL
jgi:hypothetical protein